ncbi:hypothetical protein DFJ73DRAFT_33610 [Zopfochytrium polystomum]|nr:hypothetical protein DFJ73DRAFT_33610 [Zopfochytrium polystomum]
MRPPFRLCPSPAHSRPRPPAPIDLHRRLPSRSRQFSTNRDMTRSPGRVIVDSGWKDFRGWLRRSGLPRCSLTLAAFPETGRGLMATKNIEAGETLIEIPDGLLITSETQSPLLPAILFSVESQSHKRLSEHAHLALFLAVHRRAATVWSPYINSLPQAFPTVAGNLPDELLQFLPSSIGEASRRQRQLIRLDFQRVQSLTKSDICNFDDFRWGWYAVNTRTISLEANKVPTKNSLGTKKGPTMALAPLLDMLNHHPSASMTAFLDSSTCSFKITTKDKYSRGTECFISYGPHDNAFLLCEYGFAIEGDEMTKGFDFVSVDEDVAALEFIRVDESVLTFVKKALQAAGFFGNYTIKYGQEPFRLLTALRLFACAAVSAHRRNVQRSSSSKHDYRAMVERWKASVLRNQVLLDAEEEGEVQRMCREVFQRARVRFLGYLKGLEQWKTGCSSSDMDAQRTFLFASTVCRSSLTIIESHQCAASTPV